MNTAVMIVECHPNGIIRSGTDQHGTYYVVTPYHYAPCVTDTLTKARRWLDRKAVAA